MTPKQIEPILTLINQIIDSKYQNNIAEFYKENQSIIGEYTPSEFSALISRILNQLVNELDSDALQYLPFQYNFSNEYGNGHLQNDLQNLLKHLNVSQFPSTLPFIRRLFYYQVVNGFWDKSTRKFHRENEVKSIETKDRIEILEKQVQSLLKDLLTEKEEFKVYKTQKEREIKSIELNKLEVEKTVLAITQLHKDSSSSKNQIELIYQEQDIKLNEIKSSIKENKKLLNDSKLNIDNLITSVETKIGDFKGKSDDFDQKIEDVKSKKDFFDGRVTYLENLIGQEVGASLFKTFKTRKEELNPSVLFWAKAVPQMTVITIIWIFLIFSDFSWIKDWWYNMPATAEIVQESSINWAKHIVNTLKLAPVLILLYFTISQYRKERNFQEEYAFKSAVALTIDAYSKQINSEEKRDDMIVASVLNVYKSPIYEKLNREAIKSKSLLEGINVAKETVSDVAQKVISISDKGT